MRLHTRYLPAIVDISQCYALFYNTNCDLLALNQLFYGLITLFDTWFVYQMYKLHLWVRVGIYIPKSVIISARKANIRALGLSKYVHGDSFH